MDNQDRQTIESLFDRLGDAERQSAPPDPDANNLIKDRIARQPMSPYFMAQTIVIQEMALQDAQARIEDLERAQTQRPAAGGFLSGMFGGPRPATAVPSVPRAAPAAPMAQQPQPGRGGFMAGAAQTAMGVAGGVLLGNAIAGMFGGDDAKAATPAASPTEAPTTENASDEGGGIFDNFFGGDDDEAA